MSTVENIKKKANLFRAQLEKTSKDVEMIIAIAKQEVSDTTEYVVTKTRQPEKQLLESLEIARRKRIERINSAKQEMESLIKKKITKQLNLRRIWCNEDQLWISYRTKTN